MTKVHSTQCFHPVAFVEQPSELICVPFEAIPDSFADEIWLATRPVQPSRLLSSQYLP